MRNDNAITCLALKLSNYTKGNDEVPCTGGYLYIRVVSQLTISDQYLRNDYFNL